MTELLHSAERAVDYVLEHIGGDIRLGLPLGLGKPNRFANALYQRACADSSIQLSIYTALSLGRPVAGSDMEQRFLKPFVERIYGDYEELDYLLALRRGTLPENITVSEFFVQPASILNNANAQQHYISSNYTHAARDLNARGVNVVAQMVAPVDAAHVSLSCNPEITLDLLPRLLSRREQGDAILMIGQLHHDLPAMRNDACVRRDQFDLLIDDPAAQTRLFSTPNMPVAEQDHFIGLNASALVRDGGLLQIGIGALGDALVHQVLRREQHNAAWQDLLDASGVGEQSAALINSDGGRHAFEQGLYGCSEMITASLFALLDAGIIRRRVYADVRLQTLINSGELQPPFSIASLDALCEAGVIAVTLTPNMLALLHHCGVLDEAVTAQTDCLHTVDGTVLRNDLNDAETRAALTARLGQHWRGGTLLHGGFFLGPQAFYQRLRELPATLHDAINMTRISYVNHLYGDEALKRAQRGHARFFNTAFTMTLLGAGVADQLEDGRVLSGVGGQYNFVAQAHELEGARSILMLRSWRERGGEAASNIVWSYGHQTIPRHLRDIVVTEYGIADLRGKNDSEIIAALLAISDSRFQAGLLQRAVAAGKIAADYRLPEAQRGNTPQRLRQIAGSTAAGAFPRFPMGCDFDATEQALLAALGWLKERLSGKAYLALGRQVLADEAHRAQRFAAHLQRMQLDAPGSLRERLYRRLLLLALAETQPD